jgi:hypothetical protein
MDTGSDKLRINPRKSWYSNVAEVTTGGDYEATFRLKRPQPALLALFASGWAPIYPCHVPAREHAAASDRHRPVQIRRAAIPVRTCGCAVVFRSRASKRPAPAEPGSHKTPP